SRGTGIDGLLGIPEVNKKVVRPILGFSQEEILEYANAGHISWREDSGNFSSKYLRNKIRHELVPTLKELHPVFLQNFTQTQAHLKQTNILVDNYMEEIKARLFVDD